MKGNAPNVGHERAQRRSHGLDGTHRVSHSCQWTCCRRRSVSFGLTCTCHSPRATTTQEAEGNAGVPGRLNGRDKAKNAGFWFPDQIFLKTMLSSAFPKSLAHKKRKCLLKILQRTTIQIQSLVGTCRVAQAN